MTTGKGFRSLAWRRVRRMGTEWRASRTCGCGSLRGPRHAEDHQGHARWSVCMAKLHQPGIGRGRTALRRAHGCGARQHRLRRRRGRKRAAPYRRRSGTHLLLVCTAERGLAGAFNSSIARLARDHARRLLAEGKQVKFFPGRQEGLRHPAPCVSASGSSSAWTCAACATSRSPRRRTSPAASKCSTRASST